jgi:CBS domain-containing protein
VPVLRDGRIAGIVSRADLLRALASARPEQPAILENDRKLGARVEAAIEAIRVPTEFVTVIAANGEVHLWGAAESDDIRKAVRVAAEEAAGGDRVHDHLRVLSANLRALLWV